MARQLRHQLTAAAVLAVVATAGCSTHPSDRPPAAGTTTQHLAGPGYRVVRTLPHDPQAFTEGLVIAGGMLFESTGQRGSGSSIRRIDLATGEVTAQKDIHPGLFTEGLAVLEDLLYQLTWQNQVVLIYDSALNQVGERRYAHESWGLTSTGSRLVLSDGTDRLAILDPGTLAVTRTVHITDRGTPVTGLNELERVGGEVFANILGSPRIARIELDTGRVRAWLDLSALVRAVGATDEDAVLNGIAVDPKSGHLYVTGKLWPTIFEIELLPTSTRR